jgi:hypothetical protein
MCCDFTYVSIKWLGRIVVNITIGEITNAKIKE